MGALDVLAKAAKAVKKTGPFFSKADAVLDELQRGKGTGDEFLTELVKKGAKPTELRERGIEGALKGKPKMTKTEVKKVFEEKAPPNIKEEIRGGDEYKEALDEKAREIIGDEDATFSDLHGRDREYAKFSVEKDFGYTPETKYEEWRTPGGQNYREILLKLPQRGLNEAEQRILMNYEADVRRGEQFNPWHQRQYNALKAKEAMGNQDYMSSHWRDTPNVLAHIRVQDFQSPTKGYAVVNTRSGNKSPIFQTMEEAQAYMAQMPESLRGMLRIDEAAGKPKKVLLVDEIQSDWHQEGRKKGYRGQESEKISEEEYKRGVALQQRSVRGEPMTQEEVAEMNDILQRHAQSIPGMRVPDAPFKKNWHELAMKRVLDYAAENGYDTVAITPGAEQAKRYDLSKQVDELNYNPDLQTLTANKDREGKIYERGVTPERLQELVGKEVAAKLIAQEPTEHGLKSLTGQDLVVGGEGMKGFYDKILPDYLNTYGKQYGSGVGKTQLKTYGYENGQFMMELPDSFAARKWVESAPGRELRGGGEEYHSFDITPQMREAIKTKGQPLYSAMGAEGLAAGSGAATIGADAFVSKDEQPVQNPVHFTENPDAMLLELMQRN